MKKISNELVPVLNAGIATICIIIVAVVVCAFSGTNDVRDEVTYNYINYLEGQIEHLAGENYMLDVVSETDEYNEYYNGK